MMKRPALIKDGGDSRSSSTKREPKTYESLWKMRKESLGERDKRPTRCQETLKNWSSSSSPSTDKHCRVIKKEDRDQSWKDLKNKGDKAAVEAQELEALASHRLGRI